MPEKIIVIGSGFSGLSAAASLAKQGFNVQVIEKNDSVGGRARMFHEQGFAFDMGPSWYWMPDVFEDFFAAFGKKTSDYYDLKRLDPSYRVILGPKDFWDIPADPVELRKFFDSVEPGASERLDKFLSEAEFKYQIGVKEIVYKPSLSPWEFADIRIAKGALKLHMFSSFSAYVRKFFRHPGLIKLMEFPVLFLGAKPEKTPALYSIMNYADMQLGTWYPMGGMHEIVKAMHALACELGVKFITSSPVTEIVVGNNRTTGVQCGDVFYPADYVVASADYHHVEQKLLPARFRKYTEKYWNSRVMAPSSLLFYLGIDGEIPGLLHHNLFFDEDFGPHAAAIYDTPEWPEKPLFYVCCPSKTDSSVAPAGKENIFILIPTAPGLKDPEEIREKYFHLVMERLEKFTGVSIRDKVVYKKSFATSNFISDYNSFKGNAYGLANTLRQTAFLKPKMRTSKLKNLVYAGQLTTPGPGVPPSLISGRVAAAEILKLSGRKFV